MNRTSAVGRVSFGCINAKKRSRLPLVLFIVIGACGGTASSTPSPCPVTLPLAGEVTPPPPLETGPNPSFVFSGGPNTFLYGNDVLLVALPKSSTLRPSDPQRGLPGGVKMGWWRSGRGSLTITTKRLDANTDPQPAEVGTGYGDAGFQASVVHFPSAGCWQVKGTLSGGGNLTFVVKVAER